MGLSNCLVSGAYPPPAALGAERQEVGSGGCSSHRVRLPLEAEEFKKVHENTQAGTRHGPTTIAGLIAPLTTGGTHLGGYKLDSKPSSK